MIIYLERVSTVGKEVDKLEGVLDNANSLDLLAVVASLAHHAK